MRISGLVWRGDSRATGTWRWFDGRALCVVLPLILGACTAVPDWADPTDWFAADEAPTVVAQDRAQTGSDSFPNLASVPNTPPQVSTPAARAEARATLAADLANAEYSGQRLVAESGAVANKMPASGGVLPPGADDPPVAPARALEGSAAASMSPAQPSATMAEATPPEPAKSTYRFKQFDKPSAAQAGTQAATQTAAVSMPSPARNNELVAVIYFGYGSTALNETDRAVLRDVATLQRQRGGIVRVIGHASARTGIVDSTRHRLANLEISLQRANAVAAQLMRLGVAKDKIAAEAKADSQPVYHEFMPTGEAGNRRAEIFLEN